MGLRTGAVPAYAVSLACLAGLPLFADGHETSLQTTAVLAVAFGTASLVLVARVNASRPLSLGFFYVAIFSLFHFGLLIPVALGRSIPVFSPTDAYWASGSLFQSAVLMSTLALGFFVIGYLVSVLARSRRSVGEDADLTDSAPVGGAGLVLVLTGIGLWILIAVQSDVGLTDDYVTFLDKTALTSTPTAYLAVGFGMAVVAASRSDKIRHFALGMFILWAVPAFIIGLRGEVLIPAAAYLIVAARRRTIQLKFWMLVAFLFLLASGSVVRIIRSAGLGDASVNLNDLDPLQGLAEMGYSIRPMVVVLGWHTIDDEPLAGLDTYLAPFRRLLLGRVLGLDVTPVHDDPAAFGGVIAARVGPIGGSPAAEAFRSGGIWGMFIVMLLIGLTVAYLDTVKRAPLTNAFVGMSAFVLLLWVRNDFTPVPAQLAVAASIVWLLRSLYLTSKHRVSP